MQNPTGSPRDLLTLPQVTATLTATRVEPDAGMELLNPDLSVAQDLSQYLSAGTIKRTMAAAVHGTCELVLATELSWGTALLRPYQTLKTELPGFGVIKARYNLGVFALTTPERDTGATPITWTVEGYDRLYLLNRQVGNTYVVPSGTGYLAAVRDAITAAGLTGVLLDGTAQAKTLPADKTWPLVPDTTTTTSSPASVISEAATASDTSTPTTWLDVVNDLLAAIGYRGLWCDENGYFRSEPYLIATSRGIDWTFTVDAATTILAIEAKQAYDTWNVPNRWIFVQQNYGSAYSGSDGSSGLYIRDDLAGQAKRGYVWPTQVSLDAADQASFIAQGDARVAADQAITNTITRNTGPFPLAGHYDVYTITDPDLGGTFRVQGASWTQDLFGADTQHVWKVVS